MKKVQWPYSDKEATLAAKLLTIRNLGSEHMLTSDLEDSYRRVDEMHEMDCGLSIHGEFVSWFDDIKSGDCSYILEVWNKEREKYIEL